MKIELLLSEVFLFVLEWLATSLDLENAGPIADILEQYTCTFSIDSIETFCISPFIAID